MSNYHSDTIVALSSGALPSGIAVIRVSGSQCSNIMEELLNCKLQARKACLRAIVDRSSNVIDEALAIWFPGPASYTGEDCLELQVHGGRAVVGATLDLLCSREQVRLADAGEFSRRAFENGKMDLTAIDGIADLITSETESQRKLALAQSQGSLRNLYEGWRKSVVYIRAMLEAEFDFSDEEDVPEDISQEGLSALNGLIREIQAHIDDSGAGEIIRDGYRVALMGKPNAGKSSLINALANRDLAIVTDQAGTTRDVLEVHLDIGGYKVSMFDTAGLRDTDDVVEVEGVKRAQLAGDMGDLVIWLYDDPSDPNVGYAGSTEVLAVQSKCDLNEPIGFGISVETGFGLDQLTNAISDRLNEAIGNAIPALITRKRYREGLEKCLQHLVSALEMKNFELEIRAEEVRLAGMELGRITGKVDVEDLLDVIFSEFCVGK